MEEVEPLDETLDLDFSNVESESSTEEDSEE